MKKIILLLALFGTSASACSFDTDCSPGSRCLMDEYSIYGVCAGGTNPGNSNDQHPVTDYYGSNVGKTCMFDTDCSIGQSCHVAEWSTNGVCK